MEFTKYKLCDFSFDSCECFDLRLLNTRVGLNGIAVEERKWIPAIERYVVVRPWWQRYLGLLYRPWRKPRIVETMPVYLIGNGVYLHPENVKALAAAIDAANAKKGE